MGFTRNSNLNTETWHSDQFSTSLKEVDTIAVYTIWHGVVIAVYVFSLTSQPGFHSWRKHKWNHTALTANIMATRVNVKAGPVQTAAQFQVQRSKPFLFLAPRASLILARLGHCVLALVLASLVLFFCVCFHVLTVLRIEIKCHKVSFLSRSSFLNRNRNYFPNLRFRQY